MLMIHHKIFMAKEIGGMAVEFNRLYDAIKFEDLLNKYGKFHRRMNNIVYTLMEDFNEVDSYANEAV